MIHHIKLSLADHVWFAGDDAVRGGPPHTAQDKITATHSLQAGQSSTQAQAADSDAVAAQPFTGSMPRNGARRGYGRPLFK